MKTAKLDPLNPGDVCLILWSREPECVGTECTVLSYGRFGDFTPLAATGFQDHMVYNVKTKYFGSGYYQRHNLLKISPDKTQKFESWEDWAKRWTSHSLIP